MAGGTGDRAVTDSLAKLRKICLALPDAVEGEAWGHPVWRAGKPMFAGWSRMASDVHAPFRSPVSSVHLPRVPQTASPSRPSDET